MASKTTDKTDIKKLKTIEHELESCFNADRKNWIRIYKLMTEVQDEQLFKQDEINSFTGWVNGLAKKIGCHVSLLWARLKAGRTYEEYYNRQVELGKNPKPIEQINVSPESISLASTVAGKNANEMDHLINKVIAGDLTRDDLRQAARAKKSFNKNTDVSFTRHNKLDASTRKTDLEETLEAPDIVLALSHKDWLKGLNLNEYNEFTKYKDYIYKTFTEFRADVGISKSVRQIDLLVVENYTIETTHDNVALHGIEIKVDINDLKRDHKMAEYTDFVDFFYIAIPNDAKMIEAAKSLKLSEWGLLVIDINKSTKDKVVTVLEPAKKLNPLFRDKSLSNVILRTI